MLARCNKKANVRRVKVKFYFKVVQSSYSIIEAPQLLDTNSRNSVKRQQSLINVTNKRRNVEYQN